MNLHILLVRLIYIITGTPPSKLNEIERDLIKIGLKKEDFKDMIPNAAAFQHSFRELLPTYDVRDKLANIDVPVLDQLRSGMQREQYTFGAGKSFKGFPYYYDKFIKSL